MSTDLDLLRKCRDFIAGTATAGGWLAGDAGREALLAELDARLSITFDCRPTGGGRSVCDVCGHKLAVWPANGRWWGCIDGGASTSSRTADVAVANLEKDIRARFSERAAGIRK